MKRGTKHTGKRMEVVRSWESVRYSGVVLTIGNFDGVHRGHQAILAAGRSRAERLSRPLVAMTFNPHPLAVLTPEHVPPTLTPIDEKLRLLAEAGVDITVVVESTTDFLHMSADRFIRHVIMDRFAPCAMVEGASFGFGRGREGDVETLREVGRRLGFEVEVVEGVRVALGGHPDALISSSLIRQLLSNGMVDQAAICLGRPYALIGRVERGAGRGRGLGFPTANIATGGQLIPAEGVYAGLATLDAGRFPAAVSIGRNVTFQGRTLTVEAHLLDFSGDLYDRPIRLELIAWVRHQRSFDSAEALQGRVREDLRIVRQAVASYEASGPAKSARS